MWYTAISASVTTGATVVAVTTGDDISIIQEDSGLIFEGESPVQVKRGYIDGFGDKFIELASPWPYTDKVAQPIVAYPTDASFAEATAELRRVIDTLEVASTVDMQAATDDTKIATPLKVKQAIDFNTGTAAARDVGESAGNLMEVGAFGVGAAKFYNTAQDFNNFTTSGEYAFTALSNPNAPTINRFYLKVISYEGGQAVQTATSIVATNLQETYTRWFDSVSTWTPWVRTYHTGNILGTVSQSGGVPTGAIIERGSNVNGEYVKYADGTMICTAFPNYDFSVVGSTVYTFPSSFVNEDICASISFLNTALSARHLAYNSTSCMASNGWRIANTSTTAETLKIFLTAIGRWY